jgi:ABC-type lipoprotein export system ATPase subunit
MMRALMLDPPALILDEPLGALDPISRSELQTQLARIFSELRKTVILVTHDVVRPSSSARQSRCSMPAASSNAERSPTSRGGPPRPSSPSS